MFRKLYDKVLYFWIYYMEVSPYHAMQEYLDFVADAEWVKNNRGEDEKRNK